MRTLLVALSTALFLLWPSSGEGSRGEAAFRKAEAALRTGEAGTALDHFEEALRADPDNIRYGSEYRMAVIQAKEHDRCIAFFEKLAADSPDASNVHLNLGFAYVDKIPVAGSIAQVLLANSALESFTRSIERRPSWIGYYTRGNSYLFWPRVFNRAPLGVADLRAALEIQEKGPKKPYHVRTYISLGDGYLKMGDLDSAREAWGKGLREFPDNTPLRDRMASRGEALKSLVDLGYDPNIRVDTNLSDLWRDR